MDTESQGLHRRAAIKEQGNKVPGFYFFRIVWVNPTNIADTLAALRRKSPELNSKIVRILG